ncbi:MAG: hypothetical protein IKE02_07300 [Lachnospiraceae bacterium]|nr:hypothetical protein [Lachnospiraceae bacterium]
MLLVVVLVLPVTGCGSSIADDDYDGEYKVAMITDVGDITDQSFNQTTYEACKAWCGEHGIPYDKGQR